MDKPKNKPAHPWKLRGSQEQKLKELRGKRKFKLRTPDEAAFLKGKGFN